nr:cyclic nucleotide-gated ion channel 1-like [Tanacetum cinerariifolium]
EPHYVARRYLKSYFITDVLAALSLPQFAVLVIIPSLDGPTSLLTENLLKFIIFFQYIPRVIRISLFYQEAQGHYPSPELTQFLIFFVISSVNT